jgi:ribonuclease P protein component
VNAGLACRCALGRHPGSACPEIEGQEGKQREADLSTSQSAASPRPWISQPHAHERGTQGTGPAAGEGESATDRLRVGRRTRMPWGDEPLKAREAINQLFQKGVVQHGKHVLLIARHVPEGPRRTLFVASRRVGNAVRRNRAKRLMRAAYQQIAARLTQDGWHLGWIARRSCAGTGMREIETDMHDLLRRAGLSASRAETPGGDCDSQDHRA